ncbi:hypothetical protein BN982_02352 [Halobacillus karajensis]|uniref:Uncharacterized protein n=1 Tax=Halobacillus karajensis TaxID=195088 RepID=A0A024PA63_9BACI|nr:hypothetical protein BN982_02352 [Halobacillus karajensis]CDQ25297.1 hypothetical protein BN983_03613 [Halobacillus karajensis]CDQ28342.1 hypothetical protein BN981_02639 [Halobacillus karajensis]
MTINKIVLGFTFIILLLLIAVLIMVISYGYFNTKEINLLTSRCNEVGGESVLDIHNNLTSTYSFECKK